MPPARISTDLTGTIRVSMVGKKKVPALTSLTASGPKNRRALAVKSNSVLCRCVPRPMKCGSACSARVGSIRSHSRSSQAPVCAHHHSPGTLTHVTLQVHGVPQTMTPLTGDTRAHVWNHGSTQVWEHTCLPLPPKRPCTGAVHHS